MADGTANPNQWPNQFDNPQAGAARLLGPFTVTAADVDPDTGAGTAYTFTESVVVLGAWLLVTVHWNVSTALNVLVTRADGSHFRLIQSDLSASPPSVSAPGQLYSGGGGVSSGQAGSLAVATDVAVLSGDASPDDTVGSADVYLLVASPASS